ncbi:MAG: GAP family protein [Thermoleophilia bacterium]
MAFKVPGHDIGKRMHGMQSLLWQITAFLPVFLASPTMYAGMILVLASPHARQRAFAATVGCTLTVIILGLVAVNGEAAATTPEPPSTKSGVIDIVIGVMLLLLAAWNIFSRKERKSRFRPRNPSSMKPKLIRFAVFGIILTLFNPTSLTAFIAAGKLTIDSGLSETQKSVAMVIAGVYYALPFLMPLVLSLIAPGYSDRFLAFAQKLLAKYGRYVIFVILVLLGGNLIRKGLDILL